MAFTGNYNGFRFQNVLMSAATGLEGDVWHLLGVDDLVISGQDVTLQDQHTAGYCTYTGGANGATILYTYTVPRDGFMCVELDFPKRNNVSIWKNGDLVYSETMTLRQMMAVADVVAGDVVEIKATCTSSNESGSLEINAAILDHARFDACYGVLSASTLELTEFTNTYVAGQITCDRDGLLYTSVPQNGNWHVYVDGKKAEAVLIGDVMMGVKLTEGNHLVELKYKNSAFAWGWKISLLSAGIFAALIYLDRKQKPQSGKYRKA